MSLIHCFGLPRSYIHLPKWNWSGRHLDTGIRLREEGGPEQKSGSGTAWLWDELQGGELEVWYLLTAAGGSGGQH